MPYITDSNFTNFAVDYFNRIIDRKNTVIEDGSDYFALITKEFLDFEQEIKNEKQVCFIKKSPIENDTYNSISFTLKNKKGNVAIYEIERWRPITDEEIDVMKKEGYFSASYERTNKNSAMIEEDRDSEVFDTILGRIELRDDEDVYVKCSRVLVVDIEKKKISLKKLKNTSFGK